MYEQRSRKYYCQKDKYNQQQNNKLIQQ